MRMLRHLVAAALITGLVSSSAAAQQRHVVDARSLASAVHEHVQAQDSNRTAVKDTLARPEVQQAASAAGIDLSRVSAAVNTMSPADLERTAAAAREVKMALDRSLTAPSPSGDALVGGASSITLSTTTIIIGLLVLILLIVALK